MLTKDDLQQIREIVRSEVKSEVKIQLKPVNRRLNRIHKDMEFIIKDYSGAIKEVRARVMRLEKHTDLLT